MWIRIEFLNFLYGPGFLDIRYHITYLIWSWEFLDIRYYMVYLFWIFDPGWKNWILNITWHGSSSRQVYTVTTGTTDPPHRTDRLEVRQQAATFQRMDRLLWWLDFRPMLGYSFRRLQRTFCLFVGSNRNGQLTLTWHEFFHLILGSENFWYLNYTSLLSRRLYSSRASCSFASSSALERCLYFERTPSIISVYATTADAVQKRMALYVCLLLYIPGERIACFFIGDMWITLHSQHPPRVRRATAPLLQSRVRDAPHLCGFQWRVHS